MLGRFGREPFFLVERVFFVLSQQKIGHITSMTEVIFGTTTMAQMLGIDPMHSKINPLNS